MILIGIPDLLRKEIGGYVPGDIKSGAGEEGGAAMAFYSWASASAGSKRAAFRDG
jgi:hypothetical protein